MLKIKNEKGETVFVIRDEDSEPIRIEDIIDKPCPSCHQTKSGQTGTEPCKLCGLPTVHDQKEKV